MNKSIIFFLFGTLFLHYVSTQPTASSTVSGLHVQGNKIYNGNNQEVRLRGVNRPGTEYSCAQYGKIFDGPSDQASINAILQWKINAVRVPISQDNWLGTNGISTTCGGAIYRTAIYNYVNLLTSNGLAVIVDLHWASNGTNAYSHINLPMPARNSAPGLWTSVANTFKNNSAVLFDIYNEPFPGDNAWNSDEAWDCWQSGGYCGGIGYEAAGMTELVNTVRATGATNIVMIGGIQYASSLVRFIQFMPSDPTGNLAASVHVYDFNFCTQDGCWDLYWRPVFSQIPLIAGEFGETDCGTEFIYDFMHYADTNGISYLAWSWIPADCAAGPSLISDYLGTPTAFGAGFDTWLQDLSADIVNPYYATFPIWQDTTTHWVKNWSPIGPFLNWYNNNTVHSGLYSVAFSAQFQKNMMFMCYNCFNTSTIRGVQLWVNGAGSTGQKISINFFSINDLTLIATANSSSTSIYPTYDLNSTLPNGILANTWQPAYIDMSVLPPGTYDGISFTSTDGTTQPYIYFDDIIAYAINDDGSDHSIPINLGTPYIATTGTTSASTGNEKSSTAASLLLPSCVIVAVTLILSML